MDVMSQRCARTEAEGALTTALRPVSSALAEAHPSCGRLLGSLSPLLPQRRIALRRRTFAVFASSVADRAPGGRCGHLSPSEPRGVLRAKPRPSGSLGWRTAARPASCAAGV